MFVSSYACPKVLNNSSHNSNPQATLTGHIQKRRVCKQLTYCKFPPSFYFKPGNESLIIVMIIKTVGISECKTHATAGGVAFPRKTWQVHKIPLPECFGAVGTRGPTPAELCSSPAATFTCVPVLGRRRLRMGLCIHRKLLPRTEQQAGFRRLSPKSTCSEQTAQRHSQQ